MGRRAHWSERTSCPCGKTFRIGSPAEAKHRHNFPLLCKGQENRLAAGLVGFLLSRKGPPANV